MSNFLRGTSYSPTGDVTAANLHALIEEATMQPDSITTLPAKTVTAAGDRVMIADSAGGQGNALKQVTLANLLPAGGIKPGQLDSTQAFVGYSWRVKPTAGANWTLMSGYEVSRDEFLIQQADANGNQLNPFLIPFAIASGTANNLMKLAGTTVTVAGKVTATSDVQGGNLISRSVVPQLQLVDTEAATATAKLAFDGAGHWFYLGETIGATTTFPVRIHAGAASDSLTMDSGGNVAAAYDFSVGGELRVTGSAVFSGDVTIEAADSAPASGAGGTVGTIRYYAGTFYACVAASGANSWKKLSLTTY